MLNHEQAQKRLKAFEIKNWEKSRLAAVAKLPADLKKAGFALFGRNPEGKSYSDWQKRNKASEEAGTALQKMSAANRTKLFASLFPKIATYIEQGWQLFQRLPYEVDYDRKGFRATNDPEVHREARFSWLQSLIATFKGYDQDIAWYAAWAAHLSGGYSAQEVGLLFAAALDAGGPVGDEVFEILKESATNQHEIGHMGRHVVLGFLASSRPDGWEYIEKLLLAAQRQEGLRSVILEAVDLTHPEAFKRMMRLILEHNLLRFSSVVRAVDVWFGLQWSALTPAVLKKAVERALVLLEDSDARQASLKTEKGEELYLALWATAFEDAHAAVAPAAKLLKDADVERRYVAIKFFQDLHLKAASRPALIEAIDDADPRIAVSALEAVTTSDRGEKLDLWDKVVALLGRMPPKRVMGEPLVWPWGIVNLDRESVAGALNQCRGKRPATALIPYIRDMGSYERGHLIEELAKPKKWDTATRDLLFDLAGDRDSWVRRKALEALKKCDVSEADAVRVEALLTRKGSELRQGVLALLKKQPVAALTASVERLLASKKLPQRLSALELMRQQVEKKKQVAEFRKLATAYKEARDKFDEEEELHLEAILDVHRVRPTLNDALGLMDPAARTKPTEPKAKKVELYTAATIELLKALDKLAEEHHQTPIAVKSYDGDDEVLLGNASWRFPQPEMKSDPLEDAKKRLPLFEVWNNWFESRPKKTIDKDGLEMIRAIAWWNVDPTTPRGWLKSYGKTWAGWLKKQQNGLTPPKLKHPQVVGAVVRWFTRIHQPAGAADFVLDALESCFAHVPDEARKRVVNWDNWQTRNKDWRNNSPADFWSNEVSSVAALLPKAWTEAHTLRMWSLMHWRDEPVPGVTRARPDRRYLIAAFTAGVASEADVLDHLIGPPKGRDFGDLLHLTRDGSDELKQTPALRGIVERVKEKVLEIELKRGELPTAATGAAKAIGSLVGLPTLLRVMAALGTKAPARSTYGEGRVETLTALVKVTKPAKDDTPEAFAVAMMTAGVDRERLLRLGFLAPEWLSLVEHAVGWAGLKEAVWWFLAHMPGARAGVGLDHDEVESLDDFDDDEDDSETAAKPPPLSPWEKLLAERTSLTSEQRSAGGVDPAWFHKVFPALGKKRWDALAEAAKFGCQGAAQKKAIRIADVLLGRAKKADLIAGIKLKNLKENVRLLGLLPLQKAEKREADLMARYKVLVEYRRYARSLGPMSREDAERTATVGMENLSQTAGYRDPVRLEWAMEAKQVADLAQGPVSATAEGVTVTLAITEDALPEVTVKRGDKPLKNVPSDARKNKKIAALMERRTDLKRQGSRVKQTLEAMMVRGDSFTGSELRQLFAHPLLRPRLERLVVVGEGIRGYPIADGQALEDHTSKREPVKADEELRLAHPHDLFAAGDWDKWQAHCFRTEKVQPFKQVFRELYVVTGQEKADGAASHRYAGQQVNPTQAMALFGGRGWATREEITKTFHDVGIVAEVYFRHHGWTGAQVEGLTLEAFRFRKVGEYKPLPLTEVPPRLFSEVMRDGDLVVSVAHVGGVDPEASASTVQMREAIVRETCSLLNITNFDIAKTSVRIQGQLGNYSVHLGSAVVHRQPGGHVCIVPVHSQHRGRLFLPFADDDPRTAEVVSKVMMLARDHEILDPSILEQLKS